MPNGADERRSVSGREVVPVEGEAERGAKFAARRDRALAGHNSFVSGADALLPTGRSGSCLEAVM